MVRRNRARPTALETTLTIAVTICFLPCICIIGGGVLVKEFCYKIKRYERPKTTMRKRGETKKKERIRTTPKFLGPRLERHLTIGREVLIDEEMGITGEKEDVIVSPAVKEKGAGVTEKKLLGGKTDDQLGSPLFKLPLEIRNQIWEGVLGGYVFHIYFVDAYRRMGHTRCKTHLPEICNGRDMLRGPCRQRFKVPGARDRWGNSSLLAVLQSCRRIYSEGIPMLYEKNTFDFNSLSDVLKLSYTILPERMRLIQDVQWKPLPSSPSYFHNEYMPWLNCQAPGLCRCIDHWKADEDPCFNYFDELGNL